MLGICGFILKILTPATVGSRRCVPAPRLAGCTRVQLTLALFSAGGGVCFRSGPERQDGDRRVRRTAIQSGRYRRRHVPVAARHGRSRPVPLRVRPAGEVLSLLREPVWVRDGLFPVRGPESPEQRAAIPEKK